MLNLKKRVLSLFSGAGGMDIGFEGNFIAPRKSIIPLSLAGAELSSNPYTFVEPTSFLTVFANDINPSAKAAWCRYFKKKYGYQQDTYHLESIVDLVKRHLSGESVFPSDIDVVTGGFPCQDFSTAGKRLGFNSNKNDLGALRESVSEESRGKLYYWMKQVIDIVQPKVFVAENVKGLLSMDDAADIIRRDFSESGYIVLKPRLLRAWEYGVPESRERVIFIGLHQDSLRNQTLQAITDQDELIKAIEEQFNPYPRPTHGPGHLSPIVCCRDVLSHLLEPDDAALDDLSHKTYSKAKYLGKGKLGQTEIKWDGLAPTIRSEHHGNIEYRRLSAEHGGLMSDELAAGLQERRLTPRECALILTFPPDYEFVFNNEQTKEKVSRSDAYKLIGNAVPPVLAYKIARRLEEVWDDLFLDK